jgi:hypothetical protein
VSANDMARAVVANELKSQGTNHGRWMYHVDIEEQGKKKTKEVIQTAQGTLDRLLAVDGRPLNEHDQQQEKKRIEDLVKSPREQQRLEQAKRKDLEQCSTFFRMIPDAFTFTYAGREGSLIKLSYKPAPNFEPPTRVARVYRQMEGEMWVQGTERRLVRLRGRLIADVKFAGGLLGYLEKGGQFNVEQTELSPSQWELTVMEVDVRGKVLFFKTISVQQREYRRDFRRVPDGLTLTEAAAILTKQIMVAANR